MVGNLMEQRIVSILDEHATESFSWERQDPGFPDALLTHATGTQTDAGLEIKAWYVMSTEITGRFKESQNLLADKNINVVIVAWCMSNLVFGTPKILGILSVSGQELAKSRDDHYHKPPEYLIIEPNDTSARKGNLQQSNVNGYKLQEAESNTVLLAKARAAVETHHLPNSIEAQAISAQLMNTLSYRLDTNFAKIDRVDNPDVEAFKREILTSKYLGKTISQWKKVFRDLDSTKDAVREEAERTIEDLYDAMRVVQPRTEVVRESSNVH